MNTRQKGNENREKIIEFFTVHSYTTIEVLCGHLNVKTKPMVSRHLSKLVDEKLLRKSVMKLFGGGQVTLFGTTQNFMNHYAPFDKPFSPSKVSYRTLEHTLYCQKVSSMYQNKDAFKKYEMEIINAEIGDIKKYGLSHRPDLIIKPKNHGLMCFECELSLKSHPRYEKIIKDYYLLMKNEVVLQVIYFFKDERLLERFKKTLEKNTGSLGDYEDKFSVRLLK